MKIIFCCKKASDSISYKAANSFRGPSETGLAIISNVFTGSPEFINITFCPFCGKKLKHKARKKTIKTS